MCNALFLPASCKCQGAVDPVQASQVSSFLKQSCYNYSLALTHQLEVFLFSISQNNLVGKSSTRGGIVENENK